MASADTEPTDDADAGSDAVDEAAPASDPSAAWTTEPPAPTSPYEPGFQGVAAWESTVPTGFFTSVVWSNDDIVLTMRNDAGWIEYHALDIETGDLRWSTRLEPLAGLTGVLPTDLVAFSGLDLGVADDTVILATTDEFVALDLASGERRWAADFPARSVMLLRDDITLSFIQEPSALTAVATASGEQLWNLDVPFGFAERSWNWVLVRRGDSYGGIDIRSGEVLFELQFPAELVSLGIFEEPGEVFVLHNVEGSTAFSAATGELLWKDEITLTSGFNHVWSTDGSLYGRCAPQGDQIQITVIDATTGAVRFDQAFDRGSRLAGLFADRVTVASVPGGTDCQITLNDRNGEMLSIFELDTGEQLGSGRTEGWVIYESDTVYRDDRPEAVWQRADSGHTATDLRTGQDTFATAPGDNRIVRIGDQLVEARRTAPFDPSESTAALVAVGANGSAVATADGAAIVILDADTGRLALID